MAPSANGKISAGTQALVNGMMKRSNLTPFQQRQLQSQMGTGAALPASCHPTSTYREKGKALGRQRYGRETLVPMKRKNQVDVRTYRGGIKTANQIVKPATYARQQAPTVPIGPSADDQRAFAADVLAYGAETANRMRALRSRAKRGSFVPRSELESRQAPAGPAPSFTGDDAQFMLHEIQEREAHLRQLEHLGKGKDERAEVEAELAHKRHMLAVIERTRQAGN